MGLTTRQSSTRSGRYVTQQWGYDAFIPNSLTKLKLDLSNEFWNLHSQADRALARLDGAATTFPEPDLFVFMYVMREATLSSQIEGTQASLVDLLEYEAEIERAERRVPVAEVSNYIAALKHGRARLSELPLSLRFLREVHEKLMHNTRGGEASRTPGEFRRSQNWIGGSSPSNAFYVAPPVAEMNDALSDWEKYMHTPVEWPPLVHIGMLHAQFETIHPFLDGNGRIGRLLIALLLIERGLLAHPILYLSIFFKTHRAAYYQRLQATRDDGDWEGWLRFFLEGVLTVATEAADTVRNIMTLREQDRMRVQELGRRTGVAHQLLDFLFKQPIVTVNTVRKQLDVSKPTANALVAALEEIELLKETTGMKRNRVFAYDEYLRLFAEREARD